MKKFSKLFATLGAVAMLGLGVFASCGSDDGGSDPVLDKIEIKTNPTKTQYTVGDELDATGLVITEKWTEGKKDVEVAYSEENKDKFAFSGFDSSAAVASQAITVTYQNKTATFNISVVEAGAEDPKITAIAVKEGSTATYAIDEALDVTITATYSDGDSKDLTLEEFKALEGASVTGFDSSAAAVDQEVTFKLGESISTTFKVTIKDITVTGVEVDSTTHKTEYYIGDELDVTGLTVKVTYSEGDPKAGVAVTSDMVTGFDSSAAATDQELTITYKAGITTKYKVNVKKDAVKSIELTNAPKVAVTGESVYTGSMTVKATLDSGKTRDLTAEEYTVSPDTAITEANTEITITSKETADATAKFTITEVIPAFVKFDAADLRVAAGGNATDTTDKDLSRAKNTTETQVFSVTGDSTWKLEITEANKKAQVKKLSNGSTYDTVTWTNRLSYNKQADGVVALKLRVGVKPVVLRVDGGSVKDVPSAGKTSLKFSGSGDAVTWEPLYAGSTTYVTIGGDADGWVTITSSDTTVGANIWGITKVAEAVDLSNVDRTVSSVSYSDPVVAYTTTEGGITYDETSKIYSYSADLSGSNTYTLEPTVTLPTKTTKTYTVKADGLTELADTTGSSGDPVTLTDDEMTYAWAKDGVAIDGATAKTYAASASGSYTFTATIKASAKNTASATLALTNSAAQSFKVTFSAGEGGSFATDATTEFDVEKGKTLAQAGVTIPTATPTDETKVFDAWTSNVAGIAIDGAITAAVTFTATYKNRPSVDKVIVWDGATMTAITDLPTAVTRIDSGNKQSVDANNKGDYTHRFKFGGIGSKSANCLKIAMNTTASVKITVFAMCSNNSKTGVVTAIGSGDPVEILSHGGTDLGSATDVSVTPDSSGDIYIYATTNAMNVYYLEINP